jgi:hypothetical protein
VTDRRFTPRALEAKERQIQAAILRYLRLDHRIAWAERFNAGAARWQGEGADGRQTARYVRFAFRGCSDILGQLTDGRTLAVEVKTRTGRASPAQRAFLHRVASHRGVAVLARSLEDVIRALDGAWAQGLPPSGPRAPNQTNSHPADRKLPP